MTRWWRKLFGPSAQEVIDKAVKRAALLAADLEEQRTIQRYYHALVVATDPNKDWWDFAYNKQCWFEACEEVQRLESLYAKACADVDALIAERDQR